MSRSSVSALLLTRPTSCVLITKVMVPLGIGRGFAPDPSAEGRGRGGAPGWTFCQAWNASAISEKVAQRTDELLASLPDLDAAHPLPSAPWFPPGETRSARRVFLHIIAETAQHAGHADIIRESLDGAKSMG